MVIYEMYIAIERYIPDTRAIVTSLTMMIELNPLNTTFDIAEGQTMPFTIRADLKPNGDQFDSRLVQ